MREATAWGEGPSYLVCDNDSKLGNGFDAVAEGTGIEVVRIPPRSPNLNSICERFLGSTRRECLDHVLILGEDHLHREYSRHKRSIVGIKGVSSREIVRRWTVRGSHGGDVAGGGREVRGGLGRIRGKDKPAPGRLVPVMVKGWGAERSERGTLCCLRLPRPCLPQAAGHNEGTTGETRTFDSAVHSRGSNGDEDSE